MESRCTHFVVFRPFEPEANPFDSQEAKGGNEVAAAVKGEGGV